MKAPARVALAWTGASGMPYGLRLIECLIKTLLPANPAFYHHPKRVEDLVDFIVARILDHLAVQHDLMRRWGEER